MALITIQVHGEILDPDGLTPAVGTVTFKNRVELRDTVANIVYEPASWVATLDANGEFTITLPTTDNPDITPLNWTYQVYVSTGQWRESFFIELPAALGPVAEFADLIPLDDPVTCTPDGTACAPVSLVGQVVELEADVASLNASVLTLQGQMATAQADIVALQATQGALVATVNIHTGQIDALTTQMADLFANYVGRLSAGRATFGPIASLDTEAQQIVPTGLMIDNDFNRQAFLVSLGDASALAELEITVINAVDDSTTEVLVTNQGALASPVFEVVVLHIHN